MKTKKNKKQMTRDEIKKMLKPVLPKGWRLEGVWPEDKMFVVQCPIEVYLEGGKPYKGVLRAIKEATKSKLKSRWGGGGCLIGSGKYDNEFFWD